MNINKENSLLNTKIVYDITKFSHLDYPDHLSCIVWFCGCNMRCDYCYNKAIVYAKSGNYSLNDVLSFLKTRKGLLDGVVISGGEATDYDLIEFCQKIKELGFCIKLDTNGTNFINLKRICELELVDYVALDYKAPKYKFIQITKSNKFDEFSKSLQYLIENNIDFEARTTVHTDLLNEKDINFIITDLKTRGYNTKYYLQNFLQTNDNIGDVKNPLKSLNKLFLSDKLEIIYR